MSKKTFAAAFFAASLPLATLAPAFAADAPATKPPAAAHHGPMGHGRHGDHMRGLFFLRGVTLTDAQRSQIHQIMRASMKQSFPIMKELRADRMKFADQLASTKPIDQSALAQMQQHDSQLVQQLQTQRLDAILKVRALLTPEQLKQSATAHQELVKLHQQRDQILHKGWADKKPAAQ
ncbi:MAG TPA: periplasmic heavy metal sensor [Stellaceae bacterium]|nr:periplasmic heavy metal sensor [Stellaceae bacterium]